MKALFVETPGRVEVKEIDEPIVREDEVLVKPSLVGMCGTDLEITDGTIDPAYVRYPLVLGHEWVGELLDDVGGVASAGDHVVVEGLITCDVCAECLSGHSNRCTIYDEIGFTRPGAIAERIAVPRRLVHRIDDDVDLANAALVEPMAVVWRALTRIPIRSGLTVAVVGDGTVALLATHLVRLFAPSRVVVVGRRRAQRDLALVAGADDFVTELPSERFGLVVEAAGNGEAVTAAFTLAGRGAMVILLGLSPHGTVVEIAPDDLVNNDLIVQGSFSYTHSAWAQVVEMVNEGSLNGSFLVTHQFSLDRALDALNTLRGVAESAGPRGKVAITL